MNASTLTLNGTWAVRPLPLSPAGEIGYRALSEAGGEWLPAMVPGEIHLDLLRAGRMDDPDIGENARQCRWPEEHAWWYRTTFTLPEGFRQHERQWLIFDGIDLTAEVFLNGQPVGGACNAFVPARINAKPALRAGENELVVRVTSGTELLPPEERGNGFNGIYDVRNCYARRHLRKPQYSYGWDWNDPLPNIGLTRGVRLEGRSGVVIHDFRLDTVIDGDQVALCGEAVLENLHPWSERLCRLEVTVSAPDGETVTFSATRALPMGRSAQPIRLDIPNPRLWWPNGMGEQPLYAVMAQTLTSAQGKEGPWTECDRRACHIGLRTIEIDRAELHDGSRFRLLVNGQPVFCRGGNWAPPDMIPARVTPERYQALVAEARDAHFTMFRMNGIGLYEDDAFFEACDRAGILLWQDFMFACAEYPDHDPHFRAGVQAEAEAVVRRLRHHPSLALWCGCNESIWGITEWLNSDLTRLDDLGGMQLYGRVLPDVCRRLDPNRFYWPCSPYGGEMPNSDTAGNSHWWMPFFMSSEMERRVRHETVDECRSRFVSEYGVIGPCHLDSVRDYLAPADCARESPGWRLHTNTFEGGAVAAGIRRIYGDPDSLSLPDYLLYGQLFQAVLHGGAMEALRFRKDDPEAECWGALIWSYNDCWGETGWSVLDHYLRRKASYYWLRRACRPIKVIVRRRGDMLVTRVINDTLAAHDATIRYGWFRLDGTAQQVRDDCLTIPANGMLEVRRAPLDPAFAPPHWLYAAVLLDGNYAADQSIYLQRPFRELALAEPLLTIARQGNTLDVCSPVYCHAVHLDDHGHAVLEDNYFDLLPGIPQRLRMLQSIEEEARALAGVMPISTESIIR